MKIEKESSDIFGMSTKKKSMPKINQKLKAQPPMEDSKYSEDYY